MMLFLVWVLFVLFPPDPPPHPTTNTNNNFVYCEVVAYIIAMTLRSVTGCA